MSLLSVFHLFESLTRTRGDIQTQSGTSGSPSAGLVARVREITNDGGEEAGRNRTRKTIDCPSESTVAGGSTFHRWYTECSGSHESSNCFQSTRSGIVEQEKHFLFCGFLDETVVNVESALSHAKIASNNHDTPRKYLKRRSAIPLNNESARQYVLRILPLVSSRIHCWCLSLQITST